MDAFQFAEFWKQQGYRVIQTESCHWFNLQPFSFISIPYHRVVMPSRRELAKVLISGPAVMARFPAFPNSQPGTGGIYVCGERNYDLGSLEKKARNQTRRGLERCKVEQMEFRDLAKRGYELNVDTLLRQRRKEAVASERGWRRYCSAAGEIPDFEAWGAFVQGRLASFMVTALVDEYLTILQHSSSTMSLRDYPNNALVFTVTRLKLRTRGVGYVSYGLRGLTETVGLEQFKRKMGFDLKYRDDCVVLNPLCKPWLSFGGRHCIAWMNRRYPDCERWRRVSKVLSLTRGSGWAN